ncbi:MAG: hypothetical protein ACOCQB_03225 [Halanaerobiaceae bacterium]
MRAHLTPVYFQDIDRTEFSNNLKEIKSLLAEDAKFSEPVPLAEVKSVAEKVDALVFPQLVRKIYRKHEILKSAGLPVLALTSEFGTVSMWDWEIVTYLRDQGINVFSPYDVKIARMICRSLALKQEMKGKKFLVFQDSPGEGMQASIFKRFYWWEEESINRIKDRFGIEVVKKSYRKLGERVNSISDQEAEQVLSKKEIPTQNLRKENLLSAIKLYMGLKWEIEETGNIGGIGTNCLNESYFSDTTPCLAWDLLFEEQEMIWGCEADLLSLLSKYVIYKVLQTPLMMSNIYPFLMGQAALKHERISHFPEVEEPENHILVAHCGYLGVLPRSFASDWCLKPGVLEIVEDNSVAIDARLPEGGITMAKLHHNLERMFAVEGKLEGYAQYPDSDCKNGAIIKVDDGKEFMENVYSHHIIFLTGHRKYELKLLGKILGLNIEPE